MHWIHKWSFDIELIRQVCLLMAARAGGLPCRVDFKSRATQELSFAGDAKMGFARKIVWIIKWDFKTVISRWLNSCFVKLVHKWRKIVSTLKRHFRLLLFRHIRDVQCTYINVYWIVHQMLHVVLQKLILLYTCTRYDYQTNRHYIPRN